jgi:Domain of unknown function (DUF4148)
MCNERCLIEGRRDMKNSPQLCSMLLALAFSLGGCAAGGMQQGPRTHLSATQCRDLTALRSNQPITHERNLSELAALEQAGYHPSLGLDPYYPGDLQVAQRQVDRWYQAECQHAQPN